MYEQIVYSVDDPVAVITLNRPDRLNAWTQQMDHEVRHAVKQAERDRSVVGIVITGAGRGFCAGADLDDLASRRNRKSSNSAPSVAVNSAEGVGGDFDGRFTWLLGVSKPVIAAINGPVAGMGVVLALCCDVRVMAEEAPVVTAFSERGLVAEWGIAWLLPRMVGIGSSLDLLFSSRRLSGRDAEQMGLVQQALPAAEILSRSISYVRHIAAHASPTSLAIMKRQVYTQLTASLGRSEQEARVVMVESFSRPDFHEGVQSFLEKRPPRFTRIGA